MTYRARQRRPAFTVFELMVVIGILGILAALVLQTLRPQEINDKSHDAKRKHDLRVMVDALYQYQIDYGTFPIIALYPTLDIEQRDVCSITDAFLVPCSLDVPQRLPLGPLIPDYLAELPHDPRNEEEYETGYRLWLDANGRIHADAPLSDDPNNLEISR